MQALGRCIRHKQDYGAIILMDERMLERNNQSNLSEYAHLSCIVRFFCACGILAWLTQLADASLSGEAVKLL